MGLRMNAERLLKEETERLSFVTKAPLERLVPHGQIGHYPKGMHICTGKQFSEAAYLILSGSCELRRVLQNAPEEVLKTIGPGGAFGGLEETGLDDLSTIAIATADTVVLCIGKASFETLREQESGSCRAGATEPAAEVPSRVLAINTEQPALPRQVVTLAFSSENIPASLISERLAGSLSAETEASVVLVRFERSQGPGSLDAGVRPELYLNGEFHMPARLVRNDAGFYSLTFGIRSEPPSTGGIASLVSQLSRRFRHVLITAPASERSAPWLLEFIGRSDLAYLFVQGEPEDAEYLDRVVSEVRTASPNEARRIKPVVCLGLGEQIDDFDLLALKQGSPVYMYIRGCPTALKDATPRTAPISSFDADVRRLARDIGGCMVGLALSSGAAKGFAHIGVIQVLEENGIEVDVVAGSSMGAYIGSLWNFGHDGAELERLAREMEGRWALWSLIDPVFPPRQGFLRGFAVKKRLMRSIGAARFGDLVRPLRVVAGNLETLERVVFASGEVATAVHASIAVPGICVPITIDGQAYIDGGVVDPLPVDVLREMGISRVIAVDAIPTPDRIRYGLQAERELAKQAESRVRKLFRKVPLDQQVNYFARGNLFEILMRSVQGAQIRVAEASCEPADLVLRPEICDDRWSDCGNPGKFIKLGREVAEKHLEEIKALVSRKAPTYERELAPEPVATVA
jgi:NTE family protein